MERRGLSSAEASDLQKKFGLNTLPDARKFSALKLIISQFSSLLVIILLIASIISFGVGDAIDGVLILIIVILNSFLGFFQEYKASREIEALRKLEVSLVRVLRDGKEVEISGTQLVPGDLIILEAGDKIPADAFIFSGADFSVNEASLTGESLPVFKSPLNTKETEESLLYFGTVVTSGRGVAKVTQTGINTRFGKIALTLGEVVEEPTPLEKSLSNLAKKVGVFAIVMAALIFLARVLQGFEILDVFFTSVALMVAAVPEGLPAAISIILAIGVSRMYKKKGLVRKMASIESLGATTVICADKTGTLTKNEMRVKRILTKAHLKSLILKAFVLCNGASLVLKEDGGSFDILGDTTEGALLVLAKEQGIDIESLKRQNKVIEELPFSQKTKMMATLVKSQRGGMLFCKGAPEEILKYCNLKKSKFESLTKDFEGFASRGLRVLGFAYSTINKKSSIDKELKRRKLSFLGFVGLADEVRPEIKGALEKARRAGIKVVMITGDSPLTAEEIAKEVGLLREGDEIITGDQLQRMTDEQFRQRIEEIRIYARVMPEQKLRIVQTLQSLGEVVAVTGDGVNDALALKQAQVGVSMGQKGTDVAKEASDLVILDDNFASIVTAVEEGRLIYSNILKVVKFLLAGNLAEMAVILVAVLVNLPTPLLPVQILWINFVSDGIPALSLSFDSAHKGIMTSSPRKNPNIILNKKIIYFVGISGFLIAALVFLVYLISLNLDGIKTARGLTFSALVLTQMVFLFIVRGTSNLFSNKFLLFSVLLVVIFQILIMTYPPLSALFKV